MDNTNYLSALANVIDVRIYKKKGSHIAHFDIPFLLDLFEKVAAKKNYSCNINGLKTSLDMIKNNGTSNVELSKFLATQLSYQYALFSKYLISKGENDFDWVYSFNDGSDSLLTIYGINNVIASIGAGIASYCERVGGIDLKQFFMSQLDSLNAKSITK